MGGGIFGAKGNPESNENLEKRSQELYDISKPLLQQSAGQVSDILQTGGTNAMIPSIQRAVEASLKATGQARQQASEDLTRQGITGTDYNSIISNMFQEGAFKTSQIPGTFYQDILSSFYKSLTGTPQLAIGGMGSAAGNETTINATNTKAATDLIVGLAQASAQAYAKGT